MATYIWSGIDSNGKKINGVTVTSNQQQLKNKLSEQNIFPLKITTKISLKFWRKNRITAKDIIALIEQLAVLINANIPIITAFSIIGQEIKHEELNALITNCKNSIAAGRSLYKTLSQYPQHFNELLCGLINVGEQSGNLDIILTELVKHFTKMTLQKRKIIKALFYPIVVLSITLIVTAILLLFVIPQFKTIYHNLGANLPNYTLFIISLSNLLQNHWFLILSCLSSAIIAIKLAYKRSLRFRYWIEDLSLKVPLLNKIVTYAIITRFIKTVGLTFKSGMPLLDAINISASTIHHWRYQRGIEKIAAAITNGKALHSAVAEQNLFPATIVRLIALGEETGKLDIMLEKIAVIYSDKLDNIIDNLNNLLEPIIMLVLGIIIGSLIIGMYLPIFRLGMVV